LMCEKKISIYQFTYKTKSKMRAGG